MAKLPAQLAALATTSPAQLRAAWQASVDGPVPAWPADLLRRALAYHLQEKRHGGLPAAVTRELVRVAGGEASKLPGRQR